MAACYTTRGSRNISRIMYEVKGWTVFDVWSDGLPGVARTGRPPLPPPGGRSDSTAVGPCRGGSLSTRLQVASEEVFDRAEPLVPPWRGTDRRSAATVVSPATSG